MSIYGHYSVQTPPWVQNLTQLKKCLISTCFTFVQIYELYGYGKYKMHGSFINVLANESNTINMTTCIY